jgi:predicted AlkP superfamily pyrophosphatase or phosphodiesterase
VLRRLVVLFVIVALGCGRQTPPTLLLVSFDGFRWDYLDRHPTPEIQRLLARGAHAEALVPPFPSKTFPSHYTAVTGLYPEHHGIVANTMYDPVMKARFSLADRAAVEDERWWGGEPIWVTGERQGLVTASLFWPGSEAAVDGVRPRYWARYDGTMSHAAQIETVLGWLDKPASERPVFIALYFSDVDTAGHRDGPDSASVHSAIDRVDETLGLLRVGLERRGLADAIDLIVTSDHGMTEISPDRVIVLDDYIDLPAVDVVDWSPVLLLSARDGDNERVYQRLANAHPHLSVYRKAEMPERLHFRDNARITPLVGIADEGWTITSRDALSRGTAGLTSRGAHGFDNALSSMRGILIAAGPAFKRGAVVPPVENVHLYSLMSRILRLTPAPNDGSLDPLRPLLSEP